MDARWSLYTGGVAARRYIQRSRRELRELGVVVPPSLRVRTAFLHLVVTAFVGVVGSIGSLFAGVAGVYLADLISGSHVQPLPWIGGFLLGFGLCFFVIARGGQLVLVLLYRQAFNALSALEHTSGAVSAGGSAAVPSAALARRR